MPDLNEILKWVREDPEIHRKQLCKKLENNNEFAIKFVKQRPKYKEFVKHFVHESKWAYTWARDIGHQEFMKSKIKRSSDALWWAIEIGDHEFMKQIIKENGEENWIQTWNFKFENDQI